MIYLETTCPVYMGTVCAQHASSAYVVLNVQHIQRLVCIHSMYVHSLLGALALWLCAWVFMWEASLAVCYWLLQAMGGAKEAHIHTDPHTLTSWTSAGSGGKRGVRGCEAEGCARYRQPVTAAPLSPWCCFLGCARPELHTSPPCTLTHPTSCTPLWSSLKSLRGMCDWRGLSLL